MSFEIEKASREELIQAYRFQENAYQARVNSLIINHESEVIALKARISWFERQLFGAKSERLIPQDPRQGNLFEVPNSAPSESTTVKQYERTRKNPTEVDEKEKLRFDKSVPVEREIILPKEAQGLKEQEYEVIGKKVSQTLIQIPTQFKIKETTRLTVKIKNTGSIHTEPAPAKVINKSFADVSFLVSLLVEKFLYHQPLYRQHQRMLRAGVNVSRGHLTKLVHRTVELLEPIYLSILSSIVTSELVCMDETPIKASPNGKGQMSTAYFWPVFANNEVAFIYSSSRGKQVVSDALNHVQPQDRCKKLLSDGYAAYQAYAESRENLVHAHCWAHVRRKFYDARDYALEDSNKALELINRLFEIEQEAKKSEIELLQLRREKSLPLVDEFFLYIKQLYYEQMIEKSMPLGKAVSYALDLENGLRHFLVHPDIPLSNNQVERAIRPVAVGRKNWLFCWSEVGARHAAVAFTLIECCKLHGINPWDYLVDVLQRIDTHPAREVQLLTPKNWKQLVAKAGNVSSAGF
jgi:transposase